jgi:hypothetical protein
MKVQIPDQLKADMPQTTWGKILSATPVVMAVVATMLAGLASSEMTRAQYDRSLAAQQQSKAGDQWGFFQAKRLRGAIQRNSMDLLQSMTAVRALGPATLKDAVPRLTAQVRQAGGSAAQQSEAGKVSAEMLSLLDSPAAQQALGYLQKGETPRLDAAPALDARLKAALEGLENLATDSEMATLLAPLADKVLEDAVRVARDRSQALDALTQPVNRTVDQFDSVLSRLTACLPPPPPTAPEVSSAGPISSLQRDFTAARLRYTAFRYEVEARLNQAIANLYELQVRKSNIIAQRHHTRSQRFFFGMLGAQLGVIVSTFAMAARKRNLLWSLAAASGLLAIAFAIYVYLYV